MSIRTATAARRSGDHFVDVNKMVEIGCGLPHEQTFAGNVAGIQEP